MHADTVGALMHEAGYSDEEAAKVGSYLRKEQLK